MAVLWCLLLVTVLTTRDISASPYSYKTLTLSVPLDHFNYRSNATFDLRYLVNDSHWKPEGPIFFYTGNEGDIEVFAQNTGLMWEIAPDFNAMLVFAEHRYYGKTMPFQNKSYSDAEHLGYLSSTQALADFAYLLDNIQTNIAKNNKNKPVPVIAFGGSYGGMLAAWMRLKYPWVINGAVASSAPIYQFQGLTPCNTYSNLVADVFNVSSKTGECPKNIKRSWAAIRNITTTKEGRDWLTNEWHLCASLNSTEDLSKLNLAVKNIFSVVPMINYPYPTEFLMPVPAHPVHEMCAHLDDKKTLDMDLLTAIGKALSVYTNYTGATKCFNVNNTNGNIDGNGWDFQACTEIVMPYCVDNENAIFEPESWDYEKYSNDCMQKFGVSAKREDYAILNYGGKDAEYSNIIFTNGLLDPWSPGGVLNSSSTSVYTIVIPDAAHHLDLRASNPGDPDTVKNARTLIQNILHVWLKSISNNV